MINLRRKISLSENVKVVWSCRNCGYFNELLEAQDVYPVYLHSQAHSQLQVAW